jgi:hypothetical protein
VGESNKQVKNCLFLFWNLPLSKLWIFTLFSLLPIIVGPLFLVVDSIRSCRSLPEPKLSCVPCSWGACWPHWARCWTYEMLAYAQYCNCQDDEVVRHNDQCSSAACTWEMWETRSSGKQFDAGRMGFGSGNSILRSTDDPAQSVRGGSEFLEEGWWWDRVWVQELSEFVEEGWWRWWRGWGRCEAVTDPN